MLHVADSVLLCICNQAFGLVFVREVILTRPMPHSLRVSVLSPPGEGCRDTFEKIEGLLENGGVGKMLMINILNVKPQQ